MDKTGTRNILIRAGTTCLHGPSIEKIGACFFQVVLKVKRSHLDRSVIQT